MELPIAILLPIFQVNWIVTIVMLPLTIFPVSVSPYKMWQMRCFHICYPSLATMLQTNNLDFNVQ